MVGTWDCEQPRRIKINNTISEFSMRDYNCSQRTGLGEGGEIEFRQPGTEAQYFYKS